MAAGNKQAARFGGKVTQIAGVVKGDTATLVTNGTESYQEDEFSGSYMAVSKDGDATIGILEPFYKPITLFQVCEQNNTLLQCIEAMEVNVDGTGHSIDLKEGEDEDEKEKTILEDFFAEPYPMKSMVGIRRELRKDMESTGNGYLEVIRNPNDEVILMNYLDCTNVRLIRLDSPVVKPMPVKRGGKEVTVSVRVRERRFVQLINGKKVFFREFNASRQINRDTGEWETKTRKVPFDKRGSEVLHFTVTKEARTPYGTTRWVNQMPSALGSRKAEEFNLSYFDAGGLPPLLILVQGGYLGEELKKDLELHLNGGNKHRAAIVEAVSASGSLDSSGTVQIRVERFGSERQSDAMFQTYDKNCEDHIRIGFRLPQMFIGRTTDVNFATAQVAYMVAEAQVFGPERLEFDTRINSTIVKALGVKKYEYHSLPMTLTDVANQLLGLDKIIAANATDGEEIVKQVNALTGTNVEFKDMTPPAPPVGKMDPHTGLPYTSPVPPQLPKDHQPKVDPLTGVPYDKPVMPVPKDPNLRLVAKKADDTAVLDLASRWSTALGLRPGLAAMSAGEVEVIKSEIASMSEEDLRHFNNAMSLISLHCAFDPGLGELCGCVTKSLIEG